MKKHKTVMRIVCAWCGEDMGVKDGKGIEGTTSGICPTCAAKEWEKLGGRPPARWNLVGHFLYNRRKKKRSMAIEEQTAERDRLADMFAKNPGLHARVMITGQRNLHYLEIEDLLEIEARAAEEPEVRCKRN